MFMRRVTYRLYPSQAQALAMDATCDLHRQLYNAALEERIDAWKKSKISISYVDQAKSLTVLRRDDPRWLQAVLNGEFIPVNVHSMQVTLKRLDRAFASFFRLAMMMTQEVCDES